MKYTPEPSENNKTAKKNLLKQRFRLLIISIVAIIFISQTGCLSSVDKCLQFHRDGSGILIINLKQMDEKLANELKDLTLPDPGDMSMEQKINIGSELSKQMKEKINQRDEKNRKLLDELKKKYPGFSYTFKKNNDKTKIWTLSYEFKDKTHLLDFINEIRKQEADRIIREYKDDELTKTIMKQYLEMPLDPFFETYKFEKASDMGITYKFTCYLEGLGGLENSRYHVVLPSDIATATLNSMNPVIKNKRATTPPPFGREIFTVETKPDVPSCDRQFECKIAGFHNHACYGDGGYRGTVDLIESTVYRSLFDRFNNEPDWEIYYTELNKLREKNRDITKEEFKNLLKKTKISEKYLGDFILFTKLELKRRTPYTAYEEAKDKGFNVFTVSEHGLHLNQNEYNKTRNQANEFNVENPDFCAIAGFEWTGTDSVWDLLMDPRNDKGYGHINILGTSNFCGTREGENGKPTVRKGLIGFYDWLLRNAIPEKQKNYVSGSHKDTSSNMVGQFNHPSLYDNSNHFYEFDMPYCRDYRTFSDEEVNKLMDTMCLFELESHDFFLRGLLELYIPTTNIAEILKNLHQQTAALKFREYEGIGDGKSPALSNEYWFKLALAKGWKVAPTMSEDRHHGNYGEEKNVTGVWVENDGKPFNKEKVMNALKVRKTFVSEGDRNLRIQFWAELEGREKPFFMGDTISEDFNSLRGKKVQLFCRITSGDELISAKEVGDVSVVIIQGNHKKKLKPVYKIIAFENIFEPLALSFDNPGIRAIYLKIDRSGKRKALCAPIFYDNPDYKNSERISRRAVTLTPEEKTEVIKRSLDIIFKGQVKNMGTAEVPKDTANLLFTLKWPGSKLELILTDPDGKVVDSGYSGSVIKTMPTEVLAFINSPKPGKWGMKVKGVEVSDKGSLCDITVSTPVGEILNEIKKEAKLTDDESKKIPSSPETGGQPMSGGSGTAGITTSGDNGDNMFFFVTVSMFIILIVISVTLVGLKKKQRRKQAGIMKKVFLPRPVRQRIIEPGTTAAVVSVTAMFAAENDKYRLYIDRSPLTIGRNRNNTWVIDDIEVSSRHAEIEVRKDSFILRDLSSRNGTFVNNRKIAEVELKNKDRVKIGSNVFYFVKLG